MSTKLTKKTIVALASMMLACFVSFADANPYSVQYTVSGYAGTEALTNFPVLVRLSAVSPLCLCRLRGRGRGSGLHG